MAPSASSLKRLRASPFSPLEMIGFSPFSFLNLTMWHLDLKSCSYLALAGPHMEPVLGAASPHLGQGLGSCPVAGPEQRPSLEVHREEEGCVYIPKPFLSTSLTRIVPPQLPPLNPQTTPTGLWGSLGSLFVRAH